MAERHDLKQLIAKLLTEQFRDVKIESIDVQPDVDEDGEALLIVRVVFDGKHKQLDARKSSSLVRRLRPIIYNAGERAFPVFSFIAKSELGKLKSDSV